jgi:hypothetical protein
MQRNNEGFLNTSTQFGGVDLLDVHLSRKLLENYLFFVGLWT